MLDRKYIPIQEYKTLTEKSEHQYLYQKDAELKSDNLTDENEGIVEYGNDFINCITIHHRDST